jgi:hypothetical protein
MMMKKMILVLALVVGLCLPTLSFGNERVKKEGTIQGLLRVCEGIVCRPGEEMIAAALEEIFVLVDDSGKGYLLPNIKRAVLSRLLSKRVRVEGETRLDGKAIMVSKAEVFREGNWKVFFTPEIAEQAYQKVRAPTP